MITRRTLIGATAGLAAMLTASVGQAQDDRSYILATAGTGGTYYPVGVAIATLVSVRVQPEHGIAMSAITSAGSGENVRLMREGEAQFSILQGLYGAYAATGTGPLAEDGPQENLRSISMLWPNVEHFAIRSEYVDTGTIDDLLAMEGRTFAIGARNSGTEGSNRAILSGLGIDDPDTFFDLAFLAYNPAADAFQNGTVDAVNPAAGPPVGAMTRLIAAVGDDVTLLEWTDEQIARANGDFDELWTPFVLDAGTYPGQEADIRVIAQPNFLAVRDDVDEEAVYLITQAMYENLPFLQNIHPATGNMALERAIAGLPLPLHPGALRYYEEQGIDIPDRLRP